ncbi:MAG: carboxylating nicotinate-nucleotide diphosphorylase [Jatrophihabitantaceae bacterium]|nr:carboxylating nicotinate-nucleotide diphosphorylase [Jatrophihabitantaceae bacterium]
MSRLDLIADIPGIDDVGLSLAGIEDLVRRALEEDLAGGIDVTSAATIPATQLGRASAVPRQPGVVAGIPVAAAVFVFVSDGRVTVEDLDIDGTRVVPGDVLLTAVGPVRDLLTAERTALNLLCHLSGVATLTRRWFDEVAGTGAIIRDTRKTMPGLRALEKYAVRCGGGANHRMGLYDAALVKDNHVAAAGGVRAAFEAVRHAAPDIPLEIEVDTLEQLREAIDAGATLVLLDNMSPATMREAVAIAAGRAVRLVASGGLSLDVARAVAETGVDFLAVGALTHSAPVLDIGLDLS